MAIVTNFFAGANSGEGFQNLFSQVVDLEDTYDLMVLKGGPGVGKNTFMREVGRTMETAGTPVEYLWCSGDPDSLDGVVLPELRCAVVDGTSPHVVEPQYPAAVDRYVDLGRFYDLTAAKAAVSEVKEHTRAYKAAYVRSYHSLKAARQVELDAAEQVRLCSAKAERRMRGILGRDLRKKGAEEGKTNWRFLDSVTHKGYLCFFDTARELCPRLYVLEDQRHVAGPLLRQAHQAALSAGWDVIACPWAEDPAVLRHLLIPGLGLGFVTADDDVPYTGSAFRRIRMDSMTEVTSRSQLRFSRRMTTLLRQEAVGALRCAKEAHDALEAVYNPYVDFDGVMALASREADRILGYLEA